MDTSRRLLVPRADMAATARSRRQAAVPARSVSSFEGRPLAVGPAHDSLEREAERAATAFLEERAVPALSLGAARPTAQRSCGCERAPADQRCAACERAAAHAPAHVARRVDARRGLGAPLAPDLRAPFESHFAHDFSAVRVHADAESAALSHALGARAFTVGRDVFFGAGRFAPGTPAGRRLLAHELAHTVQQRGAAEHALVQRDTDAEAEGKIGVKAAIDAGKMAAVAGVDGATFKATACQGPNRGLAEEIAQDASRMQPPKQAAQTREDVRSRAAAALACDVAFKFTRAFKGDYTVTGKTKEERGVYVSIQMDYGSKTCGNCDKVRPVQAIRNVTLSGTGASRKIETAEPDTAVRKTRSGWSDPKAPSRGWRIDQTTSATSPFYVDAAIYGSEGSSSASAVLRDAPGDWTSDRKMGKDFLTCAICENAGKPRTALGCVRWGYVIDGTGAVSFNPAKPEPTCGAPPEFRDAATRWDGISGNAKLELGL